MKLTNKYEYLDIEVINYINGIIEAISDSDFDENEFNNWLISNDVKNKSKPSAYVKACFKKELANGLFKKVDEPKVEFIPNTQELINALREKGICVLADDTAYISVLFNYLYVVMNIDNKTLKELNHKIVAYMKKGQSFNEWKELMKNSKTLKKYKVNWKYIDQMVEQYIKNWNDLLDEIDKCESEE